jgi:ABC-type glycerol-3-phosphate transport system permease component
MEPVKSAAGESRVRGILSLKDRRHPTVRFGLAVAYAALIAGALLTLAPVLWMFLGAFRTPGEMYQVPSVLLPASVQAGNFREAFHLMPLARYFANSLLMCAGVVAGQILFCAMAAYSLSKLRLKFAPFILFLFLTSLMIPIEVLVIPLYIVMKFFPFGPMLPHTNLLSTYPGLVLPSLFSAFAILLMKQHFDSIPDEIVYAARIDAAGEWGIFTRFVLPMSKGVLAILAVFAFVNTWNSFFWPLIVLNDPDTYPLVLGIQKLVDTGEPWNVVMAALTLGSIPSLIVLVLFQRTLVRGIAYTGLYG